MPSLKIPKLSEYYLKLITRMTTGHPVITLSFCFLLFVISIILAQRIKVDLSMIAELPEDDPLVAKFKDSYKNYGGLEYVYILVKSDDIQDAKRFADYIAPKLEKETEYFRSVRYKVDIDFFKPYSMLFLNEEQIKDLTETFNRNLDVYRKMLNHLDIIYFLDGMYTILDREISERNEKVVGSS